MVADTLEHATHAATLVAGEIRRDEARRRACRAPARGLQSRPGRRAESSRPTRGKATADARSTAAPAQGRGGLPDARSRITTRWSRTPPSRRGTATRLTLFDATQGVFTARKPRRGAIRHSRRTTCASSAITSAAASAAKARCGRTRHARGDVRETGRRPVKIVLSRAADVQQHRLPRRTPTRALPLGADKDGKLAALQARQHHQHVAPSTNSWSRRPSPRGCSTPATEHRHVAPAGPAQPRHAELHARARRGERHLRAGMQHGRARARAEDGPDRTAAEELRRDRSGERKSFFQQEPAGVLRARARSSSAGIARRSPEPRSMRDGRWLVGYGMATATYPVRRSASNALARINRRRHGARAGRHARISARAPGPS